MNESPAQLARSASPPADWALDPTVTYLNHGAFGACLRGILDIQQGWRRKLEAHPARFLTNELEELLDWTRSELASYVGVEADDLALVANTMTAVNTVLRSLQFERGDELLATDHAYNASLNALRYAAARGGARVLLARIPFPIASADDAFEAIMAAVTPRTKLAVIEHVTSRTALRLPIERLIPALAERGVDVLVDGAHGPGMLPLRIAELGPAYYAGSGHKWLCAPKDSGFLWVRRDRQALIKPLAISNGSNDTRLDRSRFRLEFDWTGTFDPSAWLTIPAVIDGIAETVPGGWPMAMKTNHQLALAARDMLCQALHTDAPAPSGTIGSMASVLLPGGPWSRSDAMSRMSTIESALRGRRFEVPLVAWPSPWLVDSGDLPDDTRFELLIRVSAQVYNYLAQYERLASILAGFAGANRTAAA
ncbi:MAG TPA: aminotransferase class V-fold PLP-dependent enzyme [Candidatus Limnocylindrales bacterium]